MKWFHKFHWIKIQLDKLYILDTPVKYSKERRFRRPDEIAYTFYWASISRGKYLTPVPSPGATGQAGRVKPGKGRRQGEMPGCIGPFSTRQLAWGV